MASAALLTSLIAIQARGQEVIEVLVAKSAAVSHAEAISMLVEINQLMSQSGLNNHVFVNAVWHAPVFTHT